MSVSIHSFDSTGEGYDQSQCDDTIHDGDVLVVRAERVVGFLYKAWPVAVSKDNGNFHGLKIPEDGSPLTEIDGGAYTESVTTAVDLCRREGIELCR